VSFGLGSLGLDADSIDAEFLSNGGMGGSIFDSGVESFFGSDFALFGDDKLSTGEMTSSLFEQGSDILASRRALANSNNDIKGKNQDKKVMTIPISSPSVPLFESLNMNSSPDMNNMDLFEPSLDNFLKSDVIDIDIDSDEHHVQQSSLDSEGLFCSLTL